MPEKPPVAARDKVLDNSQANAQQRTPANKTTAPVRVLFVCLGNICRSPTAHGIFQSQVDRAGLTQHIQVDSCGTGDWHIGHAPDPRTSEKAAEYGYDLSSLRARQFCADDFQRFDVLLAMDKQNLNDIEAQRRPNHSANTSGHADLFLRYAGIAEPLEVPDPYYGGEAGFDRVVQLIERASAAILEQLIVVHKLPARPE